MLGENPKEIGKTLLSWKYRNANFVTNLIINLQYLHYEKNSIILILIIGNDRMQRREKPEKREAF